MQQPASSIEVVLRLARSIAYLERRFDSPLNVAALAKLAGLSPSHYSVLFKSHTGLSPIKYLTLFRMRRARELLLTTNDSIKAIAATVGYRDQLYFSRVFRSLHQRCPGDYRRSWAEGRDEFWETPIGRPHLLGRRSHAYAS